MKSLTKVMTGMSVAALSIMLAGSVDASAADPAVNTDRTVTGLEQGAAISFDAVDAKKKEIKAKAKWDVYESAGTADLSGVKTTSKEGWFAIKTASGDITPYKIEQDTKKTFKATVKDNKIVISVDKTDVTAEADIARYSWRLENSTSWTPFTKNSEFSTYAMQGSTIYIRYMGAAASVTTNKASAADIDGAKNPTVTIVKDSFIGKEFKVKITKKANAPTVNVDYAKGIIKKNAKAEYGLKAGSVAATDALSELTKASTAPDLANDLKIDLAQSGVIAVRTKAAGTKPASKVAVLSWTATTKPAVESDAKNITAAVTTAKKLIGDEKVTYVTEGTGTKAKFKITNTGDTTYEIFKKGDDVVTAKPVATLKAKTGKVEWTATKMPATQELVIRVAGDKKAGKLPSDVSADTFKAYYPPAPTASPSV